MLRLKLVKCFWFKGNIYYGEREVGRGREREGEDREKEIGLKDVLWYDKLCCYFLFIFLNYSVILLRIILVDYRICKIEKGKVLRFILIINLYN